MNQKTNKMADMTIPNTILSQLKTLGGIKMMCWGAHNFVGCGKERFLRITVSGMKFQGYVKITLNGLDYYDISFIKKNGEVKKEVENISFDEMVDVIDNYIEKTDAYAW